MPSLSKHEVIEAFQNMLKQKIDLAQKTLDDTITSRDSESKSSAGDKYETGRAMAQIAQQQNEIQLSQLVKHFQQISLIKPNKTSSKIEFGSLIQTSSIWFLVSVGIGNLKVKEENVYSISISSPLGQAFQGKQEGATVEFNGKEYKILSLS